MSSYYRQQLEDWLKTIDVRADRVLDVGGSQLPVQGRTRSWVVNEYKILDLPDPHEGKKPDEPFDINNEWEHGCNPSDVVFCLEVMEYVWDPKTAIENLALFTKEGGALFISFPFIYPHHNPAGEDCLRYTRWGVGRLLTSCGFKIEEIVPRLERSSLSIKTWFEVNKMRPSKNFDGHNEIGYLVKAIKI